MYLVGLDIGTTGCKAVLFDAQGRLVKSASREYAVSMPQPGWAEQDAEQVWRLAQEALLQALEQANVHEVAAIGLAVQGEAVMPVDAAGKALRPAILGMDTRTDPQNTWLKERFGAQALYNQTGMPVHTINTLPKLLWLKQHEPAVWKQAARFLLYEDFLIQKMTGQPLISRCLASRTQLCALSECGRASDSSNGWSPELLAALELEPERLAPVVPSGTPAGALLPALTQQLGLRRPPLVVTGGHDQACGALGVGLVQPGLAMVSTGTAEVVEVALASPSLTPALFAGNISVYSHVVPGLYLAMTLNHSGGLLLRWFRDTFCQAEIEQARQSNQDAYDLLLQGASPEPSGLLCLPHFAGSGTPWFDTASRGAILGLSFATTRTDLAKAILEGLTYELRLNLDILRESQVPITELRAIGGGARSELWLQLKADITGLPVVAPRVTEAAALGAAILAGSGAGVYPDAAQAARSLLRLERTYLPDPERLARYARHYLRYRQVYPSIAPLYHGVE